MIEQLIPQNQLDHRFFFLFVNKEKASVFWLELVDQLLFQCAREFNASDFLEQIIICALTIC